MVANPPPGESPALPVIFAQIPLAFLSMINLIIVRGFYEARPVITGLTSMFIPPISAQNNLTNLNITGGTIAQIWRLTARTSLIHCQNERGATQCVCMSYSLNLNQGASLAVRFYFFVVPCWWMFSGTANYSPW
ncbi:hypothetical protein CHM61_000060 [Escherichia coli]|nr:hypothetical protein [Escherichia coli]